MQPKPGQRIELVAMDDDPDPIPVGTRGTVRSATWVGGIRGGFLQIDVAWDNGRTLMLTVPPDRYRVIED